MENHSGEKPLPVETGQGLSVSYKGRFLYSKYSPKRAIERAVEEMQILPGTLLVALSPLLWHGLEPLTEKLPEKCFVLGVETDEKLHALAKGGLEKSGFGKSGKVALLPFEENLEIVKIILGEKKVEGLDIPDIFDFKRARKIEMSGGVNLNRPLYEEIAVASENAVASFWKNRVTLSKMGRLFSKNLFLNLGNLAKNRRASTIRPFLAKVGKPILVFGAGESAEMTLAEIDSEKLENFFVIAVDAAVPLLRTKTAKIDAIAAVESQLAIEKSYIGGGAKDSVIFADMLSRRQVTEHGKRTAYFCSNFARMRFLEKLAKNAFFPPLLPPLGSVGLTATYLALLLRKDTSVPVCVTGLDFSFSAGKTHANGTHAHIQRLSESNRLSPQENFGAAFSRNSRKFSGKDGKTAFTTANLSSYAESFRATFSNQKNLFDAGKSGIDLGIPKIGIRELLKTCEKSVQTDFENPPPDEKIGEGEIESYLRNELHSVRKIREILSEGGDSATLKKLISEREYLFLHFPDGHRCDTDSLSFLKRVRGECDSFEKIIKTALEAEL